jgi:hypothetical protein
LPSEPAAVRSASTSGVPPESSVASVRASCAAIAVRASSPM